MNLQKSYKDRTFNLNNDVSLGHGFSTSLYPLTESYFLNLILIMPTPYLYVTFSGIYPQDIQPIIPTLFYFSNSNQNLDVAFNDLIRAESYCKANNLSAIIYDKDYKPFMYKKTNDLTWYFYLDAASDTKPPSYSDVHAFFKEVMLGDHKLLIVGNNIKIINKINLGYFALYILPTFINVYFQIGEGERKLSLESINFFYYLCCRHFVISPMTEGELKNVLAVAYNYPFPNFVKFKFRNNINPKSLQNHAKPHVKKKGNDPAKDFIDNYIPYYLNPLFEKQNKICKLSSFFNFINLPENSAIFAIDSDIKISDASGIEHIVISKEDIVFAGIDKNRTLHFVFVDDIEIKCGMNVMELSQFLDGELVTYGYTDIEVHIHPVSKL